MNINCTLDRFTMVPVFRSRLIALAFVGIAIAGTARFFLNHGCRWYHVVIAFLVIILNRTSGRAYVERVADIYIMHNKPKIISEYGKGYAKFLDDYHPMKWRPGRRWTYQIYEFYEAPWDGYTGLIFTLRESAIVFMFVELAVWCLQNYVLPPLTTCFIFAGTYLSALTCSFLLTRAAWKRAICRWADKFKKEIDEDLELQNEFQAAYKATSGTTTQILRAEVVRLIHAGINPEAVSFKKQVFQPPF